MIQYLHLLWNPSNGFDLGFFKIRYYSLMFLIAFSLGWFLMKKIYDREGESSEKLDKLLVYTVFSTLLGARLGHVFFYDWAYYKNHLIEILLPFRFTPEFQFTGFTGLASHGAAIGVILAMALYSKNIIKKPLLWILDRIVVPVTIGGMFVRFGNFFNSEIVGKPTDFFLGVRFLRDRFTESEAVNFTGISNVDKAYEAIAENPQYIELLNNVPAIHPAQLYEAAGYFILFWILYFLYWKTSARNYLGRLFGVFLVFLWTIRFLVEFVKASQGGFESFLGVFSTGQWLSIPFIVIGIYLWRKSSKRIYKKN